MGLFLVYILKSAICLAAFYLFYKVLLSRETFHRFNRFALLGLLALSALLPLLKVTLDQPAEMGQAVIMAESWLLEVVSDESATTSFGFAQILLLCYLLGILFFFGRFVYSIVRLLQLLRKGRRVPLATYLPEHTDITLIAMPQAIAPFSWMHYIVVSEKDLEENAREILLHECAHIRQHHSWDLLLAEVCILFQWFNPAAWLLKQELQTIHEYEADSQVLHDGIDARHYQLLLIKKAVGTKLYSMANNLNHSNLKKRITMMMKRRSNPWARCKYLYVLPLAVIAVTAFARPEVQEASSAISEVKVNDLIGNLVTNQEEKLISSLKTMEVPQQAVP